MHVDDPQQRTWWKTRYGIALLVFLCVAASFLITEHWAHVIPYLPFLLFLLCPLMHFLDRLQSTAIRQVRRLGN
jgi:hypothetical protein